ncbi:unnamed protein product [Rhizophagus irregularis]|nr:unnamed protein product [Rhizophagus irregularis]
MVSTDNNFTLTELGDFLKHLDEEFFTSLFEQTLQVLQTTSATGIYQTATDFEPALYKHAYTCLLYKMAKEYLGKNKEKSCDTQTIIDVPNRNQGLPDYTSMDMEIIDEPKHQSPVVPLVTQTKLNVQAQPYTPRGKKRVTYADVVTGSGSNDSWPTSPSPEEKRNTHETSKKGSTNEKSQQQKTKKFKLTLKKTISTVMTGYMPEDKANVCEIVIYDIPSTMPQLDILTNLGKWGQWALTN